MRFRVNITPAALEAIRAQASYIAVDAKSPMNAER